ncbi:uncharacterized protein LOC126700653 [Quercus robur]|uniref:uncharacterized protein LOC126700653 n=1 Tax=Quercus robur TaxID=38942 RepID=UPI002163748F|nr:uncharacterized protein LOC126700653 [Quercus robur]
MVAVWIRLPELPIEYYELSVLREVGNTIGPVLRIDSNTTTKVRGRYACICVQVDLNKPLVQKILLEGWVQEIQYEGINTLCFSCGRVRHRQEGCPYTVRAEPFIPQTTTEATSTADDLVGNERDGAHDVDSGKGSDIQNFGPWMLVQRKKPWTRSPGSRDNHQKLAPVHGSKSSGNLETHTSRAPRPDSRSDLAGASGSTDGKGRKGRKDHSVDTADKTEGKVSGKGMPVPFSFQFGSPARNQASPVSYPGGSATIFAASNQCSGQLDLGSNTLTESGQKS